MVAFQPDSLIFDLDGTLWDASESCVDAWNDASAKSGLSDKKVGADFIRALSGLRMNDIMLNYYPGSSTQSRQLFLQYYNELENVNLAQMGGRLYPGVAETLPLLQQKFPLFIVSNCLEGYIENFLDFFKFRALFTDFESAGNTGLSKAENIQLIIRRNSLKHPLYIGDTGWDADAASLAGVPFLFANYGFGKNEKNYDSIRSFGDLTIFLDQTSF